MLLVRKHPEGKIPEIRAKSLFLRDTGDPFSCGIPLGHFSFFINKGNRFISRFNKGPEPGLAPAQFPLCCTPPDGLPDLMCQFCKLCGNLATLLEIKIGSMVYRVDDNLFASPAGEKNKRNIAEPLPGRL